MIIEIDDILVSSEIITEYFACDYDACKGVCCVIGDSGAPMTEAESEALEREWPVYKDLMTDVGRRCVDEKGFFEIDRDGDMVTPIMDMSVEEREATGMAVVKEGNDLPCAFTMYEDGNCLCAVERSFCQGKCRFKKPISCSLYPIRVSQFATGQKALNLHRWAICHNAFDKGRREGTRVYQFLKGPLTEAFGEEFYSQLCEAARMLEARS